MQQLNIEAIENLLLEYRMKIALCPFWHFLRRRDLESEMRAIQYIYGLRTTNW